MTDPVNDGGPAFPCEDHYNPRGKFHQTGMTLRDWFAGQALAGILANQARLQHLVPPEMPQAEADAKVAQTAYIHADAMLAARVLT